MVRKLIFNGSVSKLERPAGARPSDSLKLAEAYITKADRSEANLSGCSNIATNQIESGEPAASISRDQGKDKVAG